jgi:hypothetical protein
VLLFDECTKKKYSVKNPLPIKCLPSIICPSVKHDSGSDLRSCFVLTQPLWWLYVSPLIHSITVPSGFEAKLGKSSVGGFDNQPPKTPQVAYSIHILYVLDTYPNNSQSCQLYDPLHLVLAPTDVLRYSPPQSVNRLL